MNATDDQTGCLTYPSLTMVMDLPTGLDTISRLPLADSQLAHSRIKDFLDEMLRGPPPFDVYLELLEQLRPSLCFVVEDLARHFVNKPIPLGEVEEERFRQAIITWIKMARSYAACAKLIAPAKGTDQRAQQPKFALVLHRCIYYTGMALVEHHRARRELPRQLWVDLHRYYAVAEKRGITQLTVPDALDARGRNPHCTSAFLSSLLCELANPYSLSVSDQNLVRAWADDWSEMVGVHPVMENEPLPQFVIDLAKNVGLRQSSDGEEIKHLRRLDTAALAEHLKQIRQQLDRKFSPAKLGLGESCSVRQCKRLLDHLLHPWSQVLAPRAFPRRPTSGEARLGIGFSATLACVKGKGKSRVVDPASSSWILDMFPPGVVSDSSSEPVQPSSINAQDNWRVLDQSANGFRLTRSAAGGRVAHGQLLAICPPDGERFLLAQVTWLMQKRRGDLVAGIAALPGIPAVVKIRGSITEGSEAQSRAQAFRLPAVSSSSKPSLVMQHGWFQAGREIEIKMQPEIATQPAQRVRFRRLIKSGLDFERVSYSVESSG